MKFKFSFLLFTLLIFSKVKSQNYYTKYKNVLKETPLHLRAKKVNNLLELCEKEKAFFDFGKIAYDYSVKVYKRDLLLAIQYTNNALEKFEAINYIKDEYVFTLYRIAKFYYYNKEYDKSIYYYTKIIELNNNKHKVAQAYGEIGRSYLDTQNFFEAVRFFKKGIFLLEKEIQLNSPTKKYLRTLISHYNNLSLVYNNLNLTNEEATVLKKIEKTLTQINFSRKTKMSIFNTIGNFYAREELYNFKLSKKYLLKRLKLSKNLQDSNIESSTLNNLAYLYNVEKKDSALYFLKKSLKKNPKELLKAQIYDNYNTYYLVRNDLKKALYYSNKSLSVFFNYEEIKDTLITNLKRVFNKEYILYFLNRKAEILIKLYKKDNDKIHLSNAFKAIQTADKLIDIIQADISETKTKLYWRKEASKAYFKGAYISYLLNKKSSVFYFSEKNKAVLLTEEILKNTQYVNLPKNITNKINHLKENIYFLENRIRESKNIVKKDIIEDSLFNSKAAYSNFYDSIKSTYPNFFKKEFNSDILSLNKVQENLTENDIIISYLWNKIDNTNEIILGQYITNQKTTLFKIKNVDTLNLKLKSFRKLISKPLKTKQEQTEFQKVSHHLYKLLFPKNIIDSITNKNITLITDWDLQNIPFDALIVKKNTYDYLLNFSTINYGYSMSFSKYNNAIKRKNLNDFIGYAPVSFKNKNLEALENTEKEIRQIQKEIGGNILVNDDAQKNHFLSESSTSKIIHLATHADASDNPWIAFHDKKLELNDLYTYKNNADLVILSACNTSIGKIEQGEGVYSLARGFFYSGAKSVISSLWSVNDKSTSTIMTHFYKNLNSGQSKSEALTNAKRAYLKAHSLTAASPYYWASFVLIGDSTTIQLSNHNYFYFTLSLLFIGFIFFL